MIPPVSSLRLRIRRDAIYRVSTIRDLFFKRELTPWNLRSKLFQRGEFVYNISTKIVKFEIILDILVFRFLEAESLS